MSPRKTDAACALWIATQARPMAAPLASWLANQSLVAALGWLALRLQDDRRASAAFTVAAARTCFKPNRALLSAR